MNAGLNRRTFLGVSAAGAAGLVILHDSRSARGYAANGKLSIAAIGAGGRGASNLQGVASENIVALCDADERRAEGSYQKYPKAAKYVDYRRLLDEMDRQIDAVVVSAPNHIHVPASVTAMRRGKHAYCEKPLSHSVYEARVAARVAAEKKVATQMGTQIHASGNYRRILELIRAGAIGQVRECHCWSSARISVSDRPKETPPVPAGLHWDVWLGPAPYRPYHPCYVPHGWHYWWDFGGGHFGNMGCHYFDLAFWALDLRHPQIVEAEGPPPHLESTPAWQHARYHFPARGDMPSARLTWTHGDSTRKPQIFKDHKAPDWAWGLFVGSQGCLAVNYDRWKLLPEEQFAGFQPPPPSIPDSIGHHQEWIVACKTGSPTSCNFDYSGAVTEAVLLGNIAYRTGKKLEWDGPSMRVTNCPEANSYLQRDYRSGWRL